MRRRDAGRDRAPPGRSDPRILAAAVSRRALSPSLMPRTPATASAPWSASQRSTAPLPAPAASIASPISSSSVDSGSLPRAATRMARWRRGSELTAGRSYTGPDHPSIERTIEAESRRGARSAAYTPGREARGGDRPQRGRRRPRRRAPREGLPGDAAALVGRLPQAVERDDRPRRRGRQGRRGHGDRAGELHVADAGRQPDAADHGAGRVLHAVPARGRGRRRDGLRPPGRALRAPALFSAGADGPSEASDEPVDPTSSPAGYSAWVRPGGQRSCSSVARQRRHTRGCGSA